MMKEKDWLILCALFFIAGVFITFVFFSYSENNEEEPIQIEKQIAKKLCEENCRVIYSVQGDKTYTVDNLSMFDLINEGFINCNGVVRNETLHFNVLESLGWDSALYGFSVRVYFNGYLYAGAIYN